MRHKAHGDIRIDGLQKMIFGRLFDATAVKISMIIERAITGRATGKLLAAVPAADHPVFGMADITGGLHFECRRFAKRSRLTNRRRQKDRDDRQNARSVFVPQVNHDGYSSSNPC
jgi:hypothetical protein